MPSTQTGIPGKALFLATAGGILVYAGLRDSNPLDAVRAILSGKPPPLPEGKTIRLTPFGEGDINAGSVAGGTAVGAAAARVALQQVGKPYRWGGIGPDSFDCSGLISYAYRLAGANIGRMTSATFVASPKWVKISRAQIGAGDVLWKPGHVALATSNSGIVEAYKRGEPVTARPIVEGRFKLFLRYAPRKAVASGRAI